MNSFRSLVLPLRLRDRYGLWSAAIAALCKWRFRTSFHRELWLTGRCAVFARSTIVTRATLLQRNVARIRLSVQWMADEYFGCCTRTLTTREVVTERQSDNRKRKRFPRSTSPDSKT